MPLYCGRGIHDPTSIGKVPENTRLRLIFARGISPVEMTSFAFLLQHRDTQAIFRLLNIKVLYSTYFPLEPVRYFVHWYNRVQSRQFIGVRFNTNS